MRATARTCYFKSAPDGVASVARSEMILLEAGGSLVKMACARVNPHKRKRARGIGTTDCPCRSILGLKRIARVKIEKEVGHSRRLHARSLPRTAISLSRSIPGGRRMPPRLQICNGFPFARVTANRKRDLRLTRCQFPYRATAEFIE